MFRVQRTARCPAFSISFKNIRTGFSSMFSSITDVRGIPDATKPDVEGNLASCQYVTKWE